MSDRRSFLKAFGIGTVIVPVIGGIPEAGVRATLIEVPKVEIVSPAALSGESDLIHLMRNGLADLHVWMRTKDGKAFHIEVETLVTDMEIEHGPPLFGGGFVKSYTGRTTFTLRGRLLNESRATSL